MKEDGESLVEALAAAAHVRWEAGLDHREAAIAKRAIIDTLGVAVAGWHLESAVRGWAAISELNPSAGGRGGVIGLGICTDPLNAATINGLLAHAQLYDDNNELLSGHPSAPLVAVLVALGPVVEATGEELLRAYVSGYEVTMALSRLLMPEHYSRGWHSTTTLGVFGATVAAASLLRLGVDKTAHALGIASSTAGGVRANFGTMTMGLHVGIAARNGLMAATLAGKGFTSSSTALDGKNGFIRAYQDGVTTGSENYALRMDELTTSGIIQKTFPVGFPIQCAVEAALNLPIAIDDIGRISSIECYVDSTYGRALRDDLAMDAYSTRVSLRYCVAVALVNRRLTLEDVERPSDDPRVRRLMEMIEVKHDPHLDEIDNGLGEKPSRIVVSVDGVEVESSIDRPLGSLARPLTDEQISAKFRSCVGSTLPADVIDRSLGMLFHLEDQGASKELYQSLCCGPVREESGQDARED